MLNKRHVFLGIVLAQAVSQLCSTIPAAAQLRKTAIIVENRAGKGFDDKVPVFEDLLANRVAGEGFSILSRDVVTRALKDYGRSATGEATQLDKDLENNTSALRLAQNLGADYVLVPSITTYGTEKKIYKGNDVVTINTTHTLRVGYKVVEANEGGAIRGATVMASKTIRQSEGLQVENSDVINELLDDAAGQLAQALAKLVKPGASAAAPGAAGPAVTASDDVLPVSIAPAKLVSVTIACSLTDIKEQPITVPDISLSKDNKVIRGKQDLEVQALDVTVELDGVALGSAPGTFQARPGLHKIRLSREGFTPWERTINVFDGQKLKVALQMSPSGYARWKDNMAFLQMLENDRKLTDAQVKLIEGMAKFWGESHYRVDTGENIKIYKSLY